MKLFHDDLKNNDFFSPLKNRDITHYKINDQIVKIDELCRHIQNFIILAKDEGYTSLAIQNEIDWLQELLVSYQGLLILAETTRDSDSSKSEEIYMVADNIRKTMYLLQQNKQDADGIENDWVEVMETKTAQSEIEQPPLVNKFNDTVKNLEDNLNWAKTQLDMQWIGISNLVKTEINKVIPQKSVGRRLPMPLPNEIGTEKITAQKKVDLTQFLIYNKESKNLEGLISESLKDGCVYIQRRCDNRLIEITANSISPEEKPFEIKLKAPEGFFKDLNRMNDLQVNNKIILPSTSTRPSTAQLYYNLKQSLGVDEITMQRIGTYAFQHINIAVMQAIMELTGKMPVGIESLDNKIFWEFSRDINPELGDAITWSSTLSYKIMDLADMHAPNIPYAGVKITVVAPLADLTADIENLPVDKVGKNVKAYITVTQPIENLTKALSIAKSTIAIQDVNPAQPIAQKFLVLNEDYPELKNDVILLLQTDFKDILGVGNTKLYPFKVTDRPVENAREFTVSIPSVLSVDITRVAQLKAGESELLPARLEPTPGQMFYDMMRSLKINEKTLQSVCCYANQGSFGAALGKTLELLQNNGVNNQLTSDRNKRWEYSKILDQNHKEAIRWEAAAAQKVLDENLEVCGYLAMKIIVTVPIEILSTNINNWSREDLDKAIQAKITITPIVKTGEEAIQSLFS
jgi:hypothetical protein